MSLDYSVLGALTVANSNGPVDLGSPKQRAVLALLLINANRPLTADQIIDGLWGEVPPATASATLQAYISNLRRALEPERPPRAPASVLEKNGAGYQINVDADHLDSERFEHLIAEAGAVSEADPVHARELLVEALTLWRGPAYADFAYEDFARAEALRLEEMRLMALEQRIGSELAMGYSHDLIPELETLVALHPLRERLWGHLMVALYRSGRQADALRSYRRCEQILGEELGIAPSQELRELEYAILNQDDSLNPPPGRPEPLPVIESRLAVVGRDYERQRVSKALAQAGMGRGSVLLFEGEPGVGKTRLFEALADDARNRGIQTVFARCVEIGGTPPFWPWIQITRQIGPERLLDAAGDYAAYLTPLLPAGTTDPSMSAPLFRVAEGLGAALRAIGRAEPMLILIDDLYSADPDSLSVLTLLGAELADIPVVLAGSHRGEKLDSGHPLADAITQLMRLDWVDRIAMHPFSLDEVAQLVREVAATDVDAETIAAINTRTEGNAFFTIELTKLLEAELCLSADKAATAVPSSLLEVMGRRLNRLSEATVRLVRAGAVYGRQFELAIAAEAIEVSGDEALASAEQAARASLIKETDQAGTYRFSHMIVVNAITQSLGAIRRAYFHERIADAIEARYGEDPSRWMEIAHHRLEAVAKAGAAPAIEALARAGSHALASTALELSEDLFLRRHGLVLAEPPSQERDRLEAAALFDLARIWTWREGYHSAKLNDAVKRLWALTRIDEGTVGFPPGKPITADDPMLSSLQARFSYEIVSGNIDAASEIVETYLALAANFPDPMVEFAANLAAMVVSVHAPRVAEAIEASERSLAALEVLDPKHDGSVGLPLNQQSGRVTHHVFSGWAHFLSGQRARSLADFEEARRLSEQLAHPFNRAFTVCVEGLVGAMDRSPTWVAESVAWGRSGVGLEQFGLVDTWISLLDTWSAGMLSSSADDAIDEFGKLLDFTEASGARVVHTLYMGMLAELEIKEGRYDAALIAIERGIEMSKSGEKFWYPELERLAAQAHRALGNPVLSKEALQRSRNAAVEMGIVPILERLATSSTAG